MKKKFNSFNEELNILGNIQCRLCDEDVDFPPSTLQTLIALKKIIGNLHYIIKQQ